MNILLFRIAVYFICKRAYSTLFECGDFVSKHVIKFLTYSFDSENFASQHTELKPLCCKKHYNTPKHKQSLYIPINKLRFLHFETAHI